MGTSVVMSLWAIEHVRGNTYASGNAPEPVALPADTALTADLLANAQSLRAFTTEGHALVAIERLPQQPGEDHEHSAQPPPEIRDLRTGALLGSAIPVDWAVVAALRDFSETAQAAEVWLYTRNEMGERVLPVATGSAMGQPLPGE